MKQITELVIGRYIFPLLVSITLLVGASVWSKLKTGDWLQYLLSAPRDIWIVALCCFVVWVVGIGAYKRIKAVREANAGPGIAVIRTPIYGWEEIAERPLWGVIWAIRRPVSSQIFPEPITPENISVGVPPRCPHCKTELEESKTFWGRYKWTCVGCGFSKMNRDSYFIEFERVEKVVRRDLREGLRKSDGNRE